MAGVVDVVIIETVEDEGVWVRGAGGGVEETGDWDLGCWMVKIVETEEEVWGTEDWVVWGGLVTVLEDKGFKVDLTKNNFLESHKSLAGINTGGIPCWEKELFISDTYASGFSIPLLITSHILLVTSTNSLKSKSLDPEVALFEERWVECPRDWVFLRAGQIGGGVLVSTGGLLVSTGGLTLGKFVRWCWRVWWYVDGCLGRGFWTKQLVSNILIVPLPMVCSLTAHESKVMKR